MRNTITSTNKVRYKVNCKRNLALTEGGNIIEIATTDMIEGDTVANIVAIITTDNIEEVKRAIELYAAKEGA